MSVQPDPRPVARKSADRAEWQEITLAKAGPCRGCGGQAQSFHHVVPRSQRGDDVAANIIPLCGSGTTGCHGAVENHTPGWEAIASAIRETLTPPELQYVYAKKGHHWLDRKYPHVEQLCARCQRRLKTTEPQVTDSDEKLPARRKTEWVLTVPDDAEKGPDVLDALVGSLADDFGFDDKSSRLRRYHAVVLALVFATVNIDQLKEELG